MTEIQVGAGWERERKDYDNGDGGESGGAGG
jgi:hypothetical protein